MKKDTLSDVLASARLSGAIFFDVAASSPWVAEAPAAETIAPNVMPDAQHVMMYHVITSGCGWATLIDADEGPVQLTPGSVVMFPQGERHVLSSAPNMRAEPDPSLFDQPPEATPPYYVEQFGDGPEETRMICGFIGCDILPFNPVIETLPRMLHVPEGYTRADGWLRGLIQAITRESRERRVGAQSVLSRLSELLFIEVVRDFAASLSDDATGWLAALADPHVGRAIRLLHEDPAHPWTLEGLAKAVGVSRTVLVERFTEYVGVAPMTYLTNWRMQLAARMLTDSATTNARIAAAVGYESEAAFSRAFKRSTGVSPGAWRKRDSSIAM